MDKVKNYKIIESRYIVVQSSATDKLILLDGQRHVYQSHNRELNRVRAASGCIRK